MMPEVVHAKAHRACRKVWQIGEDRDPEVQALVAKDQVMRGVMNNDIVGVISESAYEICNQATEPPIMKAEPPHRVGNGRLQDDEANRDRRRTGITHHQFSNLWMGLDDRPRP